MEDKEILEAVTIIIEQLIQNLRPDHGTEHDYIEDPEDPGCCICGWYLDTELEVAGRTALEQLTTMKEILLHGSKEDKAEVKSQLRYFFALGAPLIPSPSFSTN